MCTQHIHKVAQNKKTINQLVPILHPALLGKNQQCAKNSQYSITKDNKKTQVASIWPKHHITFWWVSQIS